MTRPPYTLPRLMDLNAASRLLRKPRLLVAGRCLETEKPWALEKFPRDLYAVATVCLEEEHANMVGFKLAGILARVSYEKVAVLTTDGSMHCVQLHFVVEEVFRLTGCRARRRHFVATRDEVVEVPPEAVKTARYLSRVARLLGASGGQPTS